MEREQLAFHERVRQGYLALAAAEPGRWLVLDAMRLIDEIQAAIRERVAGLLQRVGVTLMSNE
jgi:dTMP kinase